MNLLQFCSNVHNRFIWPVNIILKKTNNKIISLQDEFISFARNNCRVLIVFIIIKYSKYYRMGIRFPHECAT